MTSIRPFHPNDIFKFNTTNLDPLTETYDLSFYLDYYAKWPQLFNVAEGPDGNIEGYIMGKLEASPPFYQVSEHHLPWHAHITALTVAPHARRLGIARTLSQGLERAAENEDAWFVDLFVRKSNTIAQKLYTGMGYSVYRRVLNYYNDDPTSPDPNAEEDAYDMRKPCARDKERQHVRENGEQFTVYPEEVW